MNQTTTQLYREQHFIAQKLHIHASGDLIKLLVMFLLMLVSALSQLFLMKILEETKIDTNEIMGLMWIVQNILLLEDSECYSHFMRMRLHVRLQHLV